MSKLPLAQASFASPWMLLWGLAAALPVLLHFWNRRRRSETEWAAMEFLVAAIRKNARRLRLEQIILLAVRVAIVLFFAAALAEPMLLGGNDRNLARPPAEKPSLWILAIDGSYSMDYRDWRPAEPGKSAFERAREQAVAIVRDSRPGDSFAIVLLAAPPERIVGEPTTDGPRAIAEIEALAIRPTGADLAASLRLMESLVAAGPATSLVKARLFTDLCATTWRAASDEPCRTLLSDLDAKCDFQPIDVGANDPTGGKVRDCPTANLAVVDCRAEESHVVVDRAANLRATVTNYAANSAPRGAASGDGAASSRRQIEFFVDGRREHVAEVEVPAGGERTVAFSHRFRSAGDHVLRAVIEADGLPFDDERVAIVSVRQSLAALCVEGQPGAAKFISLALTGQESPVKVTTCSEASLGATLRARRPLSEFDAVFLCNVGRLSGAEGRGLRKFVQNGGGLVTILGDRSLSASYNAELVDGETSLLPARLKEPATLGDYSLDPLGYRHPLAAPFRGHDAAGLLTTPIWKYVKLEELSATNANANGDSTNAPVVALRFTNGDWAIVERRFGAGRSVLVATDLSDQSLDRSVSPPSPWSAWPAWPSFVPIVRELLAVAIAGGGQRRASLVGEPLAGDVASASGGKVTMPDGREGRVSIDAESGSETSPTWRWTDTSLRGVYAVDFDAGKQPAALYAVNLDTRESSLRRIDPSSLPDGSTRGDRSDGESLAGEGAAGRNIFRLALGGVLGLLVLETSLGVIFGRWRRDQ